MIGSLIGFLIAAVAAASMIPLARRLAFRLGAVDEPGGRRVHKERIARLGGLAIFSAFFITLLALAALESGIARNFLTRPSLAAGLFGGGALLVLLGAIDDVRGVRAVHKLLVQSVAAVIAYASGFRIDGVHLPFVGDVELSWIGLPLTILWIVGLVNALNLIDGLDGLAAGISFFACVTNFVVAALADAPGVMLVSAVLGGAILGFLIFNFNPATIFLGDSGSLFLGFVLATMSLLSATVKSSTAVAILVPVLALGVPIVDTLFAMVRRVLERKSIFSPDRGHIHHRLLDLGLTQRRAVLILYGISVVGAIAAIALAAGRDLEVGVALTALALVVIAVVRFLGTFQKRLIGQRESMQLRPPSTERLRRALPPLIQRLSAPHSGRDIGRHLQQFGADAGLARIDLHTSDDHSGLRFHWASDDPSEPGIVLAEYPLKSLSEDARVRFGIEGDEGTISPQDHILLQLAADAVELRLAVHARPLEPREVGAREAR